MGKKKDKQKRQENQEMMGCCFHELPKKERKRIKKQAKELENVLKAIFKAYVPKGRILEVYAVPDNASSPWNTENDKVIDDLDLRDWTREDIFGMMTDEELEAYDFLEDQVMNGEPSGVPNSEYNEIDDYDRQAMLGTISEVEAAIARFIYTHNAGNYDTMVEEADFLLGEALSWMCLIAQKYRYVEKISSLRVEVIESGREINDTLVEIEDLRNSLVGIHDAMREHLEDYGIDHDYKIEDEEDDD